MESKSAPITGLPDGLTPEKVRGYLDRRAKDLETIRAVVKAEGEGESRPRLREIAHRIKGNAALYGLPELGKIAGELVGVVDRADWPSVVQTAVRFVERIESERIRFRE